MAQIKRISPNNRNIVPGIGLDKNLYVKAGDFNPLVDQVNTNTTDIADLMDGFLYQGVIDCAANPNYPAATQDQYWRVSGAGLIGGGSGTAVEVGDEIICIVTNGGGTQAAVGTSFMIVQKNMIPCTVAVLRTGTNDTDFVTANTLADALNGGTAWTSAADIVNLSGGTASQLSITTSAAAIGVNIAQTAATDSAIKIYSGNNSASASIINVDSYQTAHLDGTDHLRGADVLLDSNGGDLDGSSYSCFWGTAIATTGGRADGIVYSATLRGTRDTADTTQGLGISFGDSVLDYTQDNVGCQAYGVRIAAQGDHIHTHGQWYGLHVNKTSVFTPATTADTATGLYIAGTYTNAIDLRGCTPADEAYTVAGSGTRNHPFINCGSWDSPVTIANVLDHVAAIQVNISNTGAASTFDFAAGRFRADTGAASTANHYGLQMRTAIAHDVSSAYTCHASMNIGAVTIGTGSVAVGSFYMEGAGVVTPAGANPIDVVNITNVVAGTGISNCLNVCNNTAAVDVLSVGTFSNLQGTVANMLYINNAATCTSAISINSVTAMTNVILVAATANPDVFLDMNGITAENAHMYSESGTVCTTWKGRIKVITPDGNAGWVNVYSTSNEA